MVSTGNLAALQATSPTLESKVGPDFSYCSHNANYSNCFSNKACSSCMLTGGGGGGCWELTLTSCGLGDWLNG
jgi:hypothetical protein